MLSIPEEIKYILGFIKGYKWRYIGGLVLLFFGVLSGIFGPYFMREAINLVLLHKGEFLKALIYCGFILLVSVVKGVFFFGTRYLVILTSRIIEKNIKKTFYKKVSLLSPLSLQKWEAGDLITRFSEDVSNLRNLYGPFIMYSASIFFTVLLVVFAMIYASWQLALITLLPLPLMFIFILKLSYKIQAKTYEMENTLSNLTTLINQVVQGIFTIKSFGQEKTFLSKITKAQDDFVFKKKDLAAYEAKVENYSYFFHGASIITIVIAGAYFIKEKICTPGNIAEFIMYVNMIIWPLMSVGWILTMYQKGIASSKRIFQFLNCQEEISPPPPQKFFDIIPSVEKAKIEVRNLWFAYTHDKWILENVNISFQEGGINFVTGENGSGKTTLALILNRTYLPTKGEVLINGIPYIQIPPSEYTKLVSFVAQDLFLFSETIAENVKYGIKINSSKDASSLIKESLKFSEIWQEVQKMKDKENTLIGERGITLSGGQKQRLVISRGIVELPSILIFDEPFYFLNSQKRDEIFNKIINLKNKNITIIIFTAMRNEKLLKMADFVVDLSSFSENN